MKQHTNSFTDKFSQENFCTWECQKIFCGVCGERYLLRCLESKHNGYKVSLKSDYLCIAKQVFTRYLSCLSVITRCVKRKRNLMIFLPIQNRVFNPCTVPKLEFISCTFLPFELIHASKTSFKRCCKYKVLRIKLVLQTLEQTWPLE